MSISSKIALLREMLESAESNLRSAKQILSDISTDSGKNNKYAETAKDLVQSSDEMNDFDEDEEKVIEGVFDGQNMYGPEGKNYPVPANYASKSKLIPGDVLKLKIQENGQFLYKQIGPVERKRVVGLLTYEDGQYKVLAEGKAYKVLLASVTYFRAEVGDQVTLVVPAMEESEWGAIENVLPKEASGEEEIEKPKKVKKSKKDISEDIKLDIEDESPF